MASLELIGVCAPITLIGLIIVGLLFMAVGRQREGTVVADQARPVNRWGLAYFATVAIVGVAAVVYLALTGQIARWSTILCAYPVVAVAAPFVLVGLYRALRWARIL